MTARLEMPTLFARREPDRRYALYGYAQVALYRVGSPIPVAVYPFHFESRPKRSQRTVIHNCATYRLEWLSDLIGPPVHVGQMKERQMSQFVQAATSG